MIYILRQGLHPRTYSTLDTQQLLINPPSFITHKPNPTKNKNKKHPFPFPYALPPLKHHHWPLLPTRKMIQQPKLAVLRGDALPPQHALALLHHLLDLKLPHEPCHGEPQLDVRHGLADAAARADGEGCERRAGRFDVVGGGVG